ncbi:autophagy protein 16 [Massarina eburnea CBS 473.64]|uniref:Autophagy protein 16 n=1 Tax=Massarina eburnea CBS 473.64 TaxID=1395130 RepID=A0A6A6SBP2_9PLEO|nr:autophagy protein 16 [Massarina eburnea CBS 473.64]
MTTPLADYLSALQTRDAREKAHEKYINAFTKLADRTAAQAKQNKSTTEPADPEPASSTKSLKSKSPVPASRSSVAQIRAELASTQRTRGDLETKLDATAAELNAYKQADAEQKKRIALLEGSKTQLERRMKDRADELKGKGQFVENVQDEMVALTLQLNMAEQEKEKLKKDNRELTERWVRKMDEEAKKMNDQMGWAEGRKK